MSKKIFFSFFILFTVLGLSLYRHIEYDDCYNVHGYSVAGNRLCPVSLEVKLFFYPIFEKGYRTRLFTGIEEGTDLYGFVTDSAGTYVKFGFPFVWLFSDEYWMSNGPQWQYSKIFFLPINIIIYYLIARLLTWLIARLTVLRVKTNNLKIKN
jgi:hypothetical protein